MQRGMAESMLLSLIFKVFYDMASIPLQPHSSPVFTEFTILPVLRAVTCPCTVCAAPTPLTWLMSTPALGPSSGLTLFGKSSQILPTDNLFNKSSLSTYYVLAPPPHPHHGIDHTIASVSRSSLRAGTYYQGPALIYLTTVWQWPRSSAPSDLYIRKPRIPGQALDTGKKRKEKVSKNTKLTWQPPPPQPPLSLPPSHCLPQTFHLLTHLQAPAGSGL